MKKGILGLIMMLMLVSVIGCGSNEVEEAQDGTVEIVVTDEVETEPETEPIVEDGATVESDRRSLPCDDRDGSGEAPYKIGDEIVFPNHYVGTTEEGEEIYSDITIVVQEATSEYVKVSVDYGIDSWAGIQTYHRMFEVSFFFKAFSEIGEPLTEYTSVVYRDADGNIIEEFDENQTCVETYLRYENTRFEVDANIADAKYLAYVKIGTAPGEDPYTYISLE